MKNSKFLINSKFSKLKIQNLIFELEFKIIQFLPSSLA